MKLGKRGGKNHEITQEEFEKFREAVVATKASWSINATTSDGTALTGKNGSIYLKPSTTAGSGTSGTWTVPSNWEIVPDPSIHHDCQPKADYEDLLEALLFLLIRDYDGEISLSDVHLDGLLEEWRLIKADIGDSGVRLVAVPAEVVIEK